MDKPTLTIAAGAVGSGFLTGYLLNKFSTATVGGFTLPLVNNTYGRILYQVGIPVAGAMLVKKYSPNLAKGMILGGVIAAIQSGLAIAMGGSGTVAAASEYLSNVAPVGGLPPGYSAVDTFGSIYSSEPAFAGSAWGN